MKSTVVLESRKVGCNMENRGQKDGKDRKRKREYGRTKRADGSGKDQGRTARLNPQKVAPSGCWPGTPLSLLSLNALIASCCGLLQVVASCCGLLQAVTSRCRSLPLGCGISDRRPPTTGLFKVDERKHAGYGSEQKSRQEHHCSCWSCWRIYLSLLAIAQMALVRRHQIQPAFLFLKQHPRSNGMYVFGILGKNIHVRTAPYTR